MGPLRFAIMGRWRHVDATLDRPVFRQIADMLRADIQSGQFRAGEWLPSEAHLVEEFGAGRNSVRKALLTLVGEGLLVSQAGRGTKVRDAIRREPVRVGPGARITARMPTEEERRRFGLAEGTPILVVGRGGETDLLPGDRFVIETVEADGGCADA